MVETIQESPEPPTPGQQSGKTIAVLTDERARRKAINRAAGRVKALATKRRSGSESYRNLYGSRARVYKPKERVVRFKDGEAVQRRHRKAGSYSVLISLNIVSALHEIKHYQKDTGMIIPRRAFMRLVKELISKATFGHCDRASAEGHALLQIAAERFLVTYFELLYVAFPVFNVATVPLSTPNVKPLWTKIRILSRRSCI